MINYYIRCLEKILQLAHDHLFVKLSSFNLVSLIFAKNDKP